MTPIRIEAEDMTLTTYRTESGSAPARLISLRNAAGPMGSASTAFTGEEAATTWCLVTMTKTMASLI